MEPMSNPAVIGCRTLEEELLKAMKETGCHMPVHWIDSGLHNTPVRLQKALDKAIQDCSGYSCVLLAMGFCGNSIAGVRTGDAMLVIPRVDDCISLLLGSLRRRAKYNTFGTYFFTEGWLRGERTIMAEYEHAREHYGQKMADRIFSDMLKHYHYAALIDTGCGNKPSVKEEIRKIAETLHLDYQEVPGTLSYLKELLTGQWPEERFVRIPPATTITMEHLSLPSDS